MTHKLLAVELSNFRNDTDTEELTGNPRIHIRKDIYGNFSLQTKVNMDGVIENYPLASNALGINLKTSTSYNSKNAKFVANHMKLLLADAYGVNRDDFSDSDVQVKFTNLKEKNGKFQPACAFIFSVCNTKQDVSMSEVASFFAPALDVYNDYLLTGKVFDEVVRKDNSVMGLFKRHAYGL